MLWGGHRGLSVPNIKLLFGFFAGVVDESFGDEIIFERIRTHRIPKCLGNFSNLKGVRVEPKAAFCAVRKSQYVFKSTNFLHQTPFLWILGSQRHQTHSIKFLLDSSAKFVRVNCGLFLTLFCADSGSYLCSFCKVFKNSKKPENFFSKSKS